MKIALLGYGKMGKEIEKIAISRGHEIVMQSTIENPPTAEQLKHADAAIDFSIPASATTNINMCFDTNVPVVVGTTGWYDDFDAISETCLKNKQALFYATNFSIGVNIFFKLNEQLAKMMNVFPEYKGKMTEIHHTEKLDAPSGTAITLAEGMIANLDAKNTWKNEANTKDNELSIVSERTPNVPGTHTIEYGSDVDFIEIKHEAKNRKGFALGAVLAAEWIKDKQGVYTMKDMLSL